MGVFYFLFALFTLMGIAAFVYLFRKIYLAVKYMGSHLSKAKKVLISIGIFALMFVPAYFSFIKWFIIIMHLTAFLIMADVTAVIAKRTCKEKPFPNWLKAAYKTGAVALLLTALATAYGKYNMYHVVKTEYDITIDKKISSDYNIALIADLHYGISLNSAQLTAAADSISKQSPDIVILCGDIVDESTTLAQMKEAFAILGGIKSKYGVYYVYGNHDKSSYNPSPHFSQTQLAKEIEGHGITVLEDEGLEINQDLYLIGRADKLDTNDARKPVIDLLPAAEKSKAIIVADHQPADYDNLENNGCDLVVSGHTHGGQTFPLGFFNDLIGFSELNYGYKKQGSLNGVVTSGIAGWGYDMRTEHHSEYVMIHLSPSK